MSLDQRPDNLVNRHVDRRQGREHTGIDQDDGCPLRLVAQDTGFSVQRQGFDSPRGYFY